MADFSAFQPQSAAYIVSDAAAVQVAGTTTSVCYRVRNIGTSIAWLGYSAPNADGSAPTVNNTAPTVTVAGVGIIGMMGSQREVFRFPPGSWFKASTGATFEIEAGTGM